MTEQQRARTLEQAWLEHDHETGYVELIGGELIVASGASFNHQDILHGYIRTLDGVIPSGRIYFAPLSVRMDDDNIPEPDLFWISEGNPGIRQERQFIGIPDLIVEIASQSSQRRDRFDKFRLYERVGVKEYWISDSETYITEVYALEKGRYALVGKYAPEEAFESPLLRQTIDLSAVFAGLPSFAQPADR